MRASCCGSSTPPSTSPCRWARLTPAERTIVAIARALDGWERPEGLLILDEPTAALHSDEVGRLFTAVRRAASRGAGVIFVSHRLDEVMDLADRVLVLRDGRLVADTPVAALDHEELVRLIVGEALEDAAPRERRTGGERSLHVRGLRGGTRARPPARRPGGRGGRRLGHPRVGPGTRRRAAVRRAAARRGRGRRRRRRAAAGRPARRDRGRCRLRARRPPRRRRGDDDARARERDAAEPAAPAPAHRAGSTLRAERRDVRRLGRSRRAAAGRPERPLELFSGGNQQKVVLAKWLRNEPRLLLLDEPTQGVDVGAKAAIYELVHDAAARGAAVLVASSDTAELASLCDRVVVMSRRHRQRRDHGPRPDRGAAGHRRPRPAPADDVHPDHGDPEP